MDLHGGEIFDEMTPHAYFTANAAPEVNRISREALDYVDVSYLYRSVATTGAYNSAAVHQGVPSIIIERGGQGMWNREEVDAMKADVCNVLRYLQVLEGEAKKVERQQWETIRNEYPTAAEIGYCWYPAVKTGEKIQKGQKYGEGARLLRQSAQNLLLRVRRRCAVGDQLPGGARARRPGLLRGAGVVICGSVSHPNSRGGRRRKAPPSLVPAGGWAPRFPPFH